MIEEIRDFKGLNGKTIIDTKMDCGDLWIKFSDNTFVVLVIDDVTEGFGYKKEEINIYQYGKDKTEYTLVKLGLITEQEYSDACNKEEQEYKKREEEREVKEKNRIKEIELEQLEKLSKKYDR